MQDTRHPRMTYLTGRISMHRLNYNPDHFYRHTNPLVASRIIVNLEIVHG